MRIGIFGGTFDPPHIGHQILAAEALVDLKLDQVLWMLTPDPPHKKLLKITPIEHRIRLVELAIEGNPSFALSTVDIDRDPPHYAVDTISILKGRASNIKYYYLMGLDSLNDLPTWHKPAEFIKLCHKIVVMMRHEEVYDPSRVEAAIPGLIKKVYFLKTPIIEISGTDIRARIEKGKQYRYFVPEKVYRYILTNQQYQD
jgi:nicotinate-nucleotide adenylyltransferase